MIKPLKVNLTLYSYYRSSCSFRVRIGLYFKELDFHYEPVHLLKEGGEQFQNSFKQINPFSQVPCLKHDNQSFTQSLPILLYLEELKAQPALLPKTAGQRAKILSFCEMINSGIQPLQNLATLQYIEKELQYDKIKWVQHWMNKGLQACESVLKSSAQSFCFGEETSLADLFLIPQLYSAKRFHVSLSSYPLLKKINDHCLSLSAFQKALPENQPDAPKPQ